MARSTVPGTPSPVPHEVVRLLARADGELAAAHRAPDASERFVHAHLAALRAAAALVALRGAGAPRGRARSVWVLVEAAEPSLAAWSTYFADGARARSAIDAGRFDVVDAARADELLRCAEDFRDEVAVRIDPSAGFAGLGGVSARAS